MEQPNYDKETGMHFGVLPINEIPFIFDLLEPVYPEPYCPNCGSSEAPVMVEEYNDDRYEGVFKCQYCGCETESEEWELNDFIDPVCHQYITDEYRLFTDENCIDLFIEKSAYFTRCEKCSPCAPNAGYILDQDDNGIETYCLGPEFWDEEFPAKYKIFKILTE